MFVGSSENEMIFHLEDDNHHNHINEHIAGAPAVNSIAGSHRHGHHGPIAKSLLERNKLFVSYLLYLHCNKPLSTSLICFKILWSRFEEISPTFSLITQKSCEDWFQNFRFPRDACIDFVITFLDSIKTSEKFLPLVIALFRY